MADVMLEQETAAPARDRAVVRVLLWVLLVGSVLFACWGTPRPASQDDFARALKNGDVRAAQTQPGAYGLEQTGLRIQVTLGQSDWPDVVWEDRSGTLHRTRLTPMPGSDTWPQPSSGEPQPVDAFPVQGEVDLDATIAATAQAAGEQQPALGVLGPAQWSAVPLGLLSLGMLGLLVLGGQPRRVTKWGMFWALGVPLGLGLAWWLARDAPFAPAMNRLDPPAPRAKSLQPNGIDRRGGGVVFLVVWGVSIGIGLALAMVIGLLGSTDGPDSPQEVWTVVLR